MIFWLEVVFLKALPQSHLKTAPQNVPAAFGGVSETRGVMLRGGVNARNSTDNIIGLRMHPELHWERASRVASPLVLCIKQIKPPPPCQGVLPRGGGAARGRCPLRRCLILAPTSIPENSCISIFPSKKLVDKPYGKNPRELD